MTEMLTIDARGLSCPEPALKTRKALATHLKGTVEVWVDSGTSRDNVARVAERAGWSATVETQPDGGHRVILRK